MCQQETSTKIKCDFSQINVTRKRTEIDDTKVQEDAKQILKELTTSSEACTKMIPLVTAMATGDFSGLDEGNPETKSIKEAFTRANTAERESFKEMGLLLNKLCVNKDQESAAAFARNNQETELKSCLVWSNQFTQSFEFNPVTGIWSSNEGPKGTCGVIYVSTFSQHADYKSLWNYTTQKIVTNRDGDGNALLSCSHLDERKFEYRYNSKKHYLNCQIVEFSLF